MLKLTIEMFNFRCYLMACSSTCPELQNLILAKRSGGKGPERMGLRLPKFTRSVSNPLVLRDLNRGDIDRLNLGGSSSLPEAGIQAC